MKYMTQFDFFDCIQWLVVSVAKMIMAANDECLARICQQ
jgi:hypothetical protein